MRYVIAIGIIILFLLMAGMVGALLMEDIMEDPEELREICEACIWRDVNDEEACKKCIIREALEEEKRAKKV